MDYNATTEYFSFTFPSYEYSVSNSTNYDTTEDNFNTTVLVTDEAILIDMVAVRLCCGKQGDLFKLIFKGALVTVPSVFGIVGNILSIIVLTRPGFRNSSTSLILLGLAVADLIFVSTNVLRHGMITIVKYFCWWPKYCSTLWPTWKPIVYAISTTSRLCSICFTIAVSVERFIAIYRPFLARSYCTTKNVKITGTITVIVSILFCLPKWWQFTYERGYTDGVYTHNKMVETPFGKSGNYRLYIYWSNIVIILISFLILAILNTAIYFKVRQSNKMRKNLTQTESNEVNLTIMLLTIVSIYLACYVLIIYQKVAQIVGGRKAYNERLFQVGLSLLNLNSCINFIIYFFMGKKFRKTFIGLFQSSKAKANMRGSGVRRNTIDSVISNEISL